MQLIIKQLLGFIREIIRVKPKYLPTSAALPLRPNLSNENTLILAPGQRLYQPLPTPTSTARTGVEVGIT